MKKIDACICVDSEKYMNNFAAKYLDKRSLINYMPLYQIFHLNGYYYNDCIITFANIPGSELTEN